MNLNQHSGCLAGSGEALEATPRGALPELPPGCAEQRAIARPAHRLGHCGVRRAVGLPRFAGSACNGCRSDRKETPVFDPRLRR